MYNEAEKLWQGPKSQVSLYHPDSSKGRVVSQSPGSSLSRVLFNMMKLKPKSVALQSDTENTIVTYEELLLGSIRIAQQLKKIKLKQDDIVGIVAGHTTYSTHAMLGCWFNATAFHPVNPAHEQAVLEHLYSITRPKIIFCEGKYYPKVLSVCEALKLPAKIYTLNDHNEDVGKVEDLMQSTGDESDFVPEELASGASQTICILNSSGTSGLPKAVCISNNSLLYGFLNLTESDVTFVFSPLDWATAIFFTVSTILALAKRIITTMPFTPEYLVAMIQKFKITYTLLAPSYLACVVKMEGIENQDISSLRLVLCGGGIISPMVFKRMRTLLKDEKRQTISNGYGSTEFGEAISINSNENKATSVGKLMVGVKAKIIDDEGKQLGVGETGEICVYNGKPWNGYYGNPEASVELQDADMYFHTGDLGYFDEEGDLFIVDRKKDIMKYRGVHYSPHEIEEVILTIPDVLEVCVFGNSNETEGDRAAAAIVKRQVSQLTDIDVIKYVASKFEVEWKRLHGGVYFLDSLPKTGSGKIIRRDAKKIALASC